jgi:hypothetical protein
MGEDPSKESKEGEVVFFQSSLFQSVAELRKGAAQEELFILKDFFSVDQSRLKELSEKIRSLTEAREILAP